MHSRLMLCAQAISSQTHLGYLFQLSLLLCLCDAIWQTVGCLQARLASTPSASPTT